MVDQHVPARGTTPEPTVLGAGSPPPASPPPNEGRTVAAWTTITIVVLGAVLSAVGLSVSLPVLVWVGVGVVVVGLVVGGVLRALGYGQPVPPADATR